MGLFDSEQTKVTNQSQNTVSNPWAQQSPYLKQAFQGASNALGQANTAQAPTGFAAQFTPEQLGAFQTMLGYGMGNPGISQGSAAAADQLTGAGANAAAGGLYGLANWQPSATPGSIMRDASTFANDPAIGGMVDAATRDARRAVYENGMPANLRNLAATGNLSSSKGAIREGILERGLAENAQDISANLRGRGVDLASGLAQNNQQSALQALLARVSGGTGAVGTGVGAGSSAISQQGGLFDIANRGITGQQAGSQAALDDQLQKWGFQTQAPFAGLNQFYNLVGDKNWGGTQQSTGTSTTTGTSSPSQFAQLGALTGIAGSLLSDAREKKDILCVGELWDGTPVYRFRYKADNSRTVQIGLLAQDVERIRPDAVRAAKDGVRYVDYDIATRRSIIG